MKTQTLIILGAVAVGAYFLFLRKPTVAVGGLPPGAGAATQQQQQQSETSQALHGSAAIIEAVGSAGGDILSSIWPD